MHGFHCLTYTPHISSNLFVFWNCFWLIWDVNCWLTPCSRPQKQKTTNGWRTQPMRMAMKAQKRRVGKLWMKERQGKLRITQFQCRAAPFFFGSHFLPLSVSVSFVRCYCTLNFFWRHFFALHIAVWVHLHTPTWVGYAWFSLFNIYTPHILKFVCVLKLLLVDLRRKLLAYSVFEATKTEDNERVENPTNADGNEGTEEACWKTVDERTTGEA